MFFIGRNRVKTGLNSFIMALTFISTKFQPVSTNIDLFRVDFSPLNIKILRCATFMNMFFVKISSQVKDRPPITYTQWIRTDLLYRIKVLLQSLDFSKFHFQTFKSSTILF